jgi:hypothetical protein
MHQSIITTPNPSKGGKVEIAGEINQVRLRRKSLRIFPMEEWEL